MKPRETPTSWLCDMDGVLVHEGVMVPGAGEFVAALHDSGRRFLVLTNNSMYTPRDLAARLEVSGLLVAEEFLWTSALATARFLQSQRPEGTAYAIGEAGLTTALHDIGYVLTDQIPTTSSSVKHGTTASPPLPPPFVWWTTVPALSPPTPTPPVRHRTDCCQPAGR